MPMGPPPPFPASWSGSTAPVPGTSCQFGYKPWARWNEPPHTDICHGGLPSTSWTKLEKLPCSYQSLCSHLEELREEAMLVKTSQWATRCDSSCSLEGASVTKRHPWGWLLKLPVPSALKQDQCLESVERPHGSLPAAVTSTSGLKEPPNSAPGAVCLDCF